MTFMFSVVMWLAGGSDPAPARAIVEKAVQAHGRLDKFNAATYSRIQGSFDNGGNPFTGEVFSQPGGKLRAAFNFKSEGQRILVLDGPKGWLKIQGVTREIDQPLQGRLKISRHVDRVCSLTVLLNKKDYLSSPLGESRLEGKPTLGIRVSFSGMPDVNLYFDKERGYLVKIAYRTKAPFTENMELRETYFKDYRLLDLAAEDERLLKQAGLAGAGPALVAYLKDNTPGDSARQRIQELISHLGNVSFSKREKATAELVKWGLKAASALRQARRSGDAETARRADNCLMKLRNDPGLQRSVIAVRLLAQRQPAGACEALVNYLPWAPDENSAREVQEALVVLAQSAQEPDPALTRALKDADAQKQQAAAIALGRDGGAYLKSPGRRLRIAGLRFPFTVVFFRDGRKDMEYRNTHFEFFNRFDDVLFQRPE